MLRIASAVLFLFVLLLAGCGPSMSRVTGKVMHKGAPAKGAVVVFHPKDDANPKTPRPTGAVQEDGSFEMETVQTSGVTPGRYGVTIFWAAPPSASKGGKISMTGGDNERASS